MPHDVTIRVTELPAAESFKVDPPASDVKSARLKLLVDHLDEHSFILRKEIKHLFSVSFLFLQFSPDSGLNPDSETLNDPMGIC